MKQCPKCKNFKDENEFYKCKTKKCGSNSYCKQCSNEYGKRWSLKTVDIRKKKQQKYYAENAEAIKKKQREYRSTSDKESRNMKDREWNNSYALYNSYGCKLNYVEEIRDSNGLLEIRCTYCNKWLIPKNSAVKQRVKSLEGKGPGECRLYCSEECKYACPIFGQHNYEKGTKLTTSREVPAEFRKIALEDRNYTCEKCNSIEDGLHVHHIEGYTEQPMFMADLSNVIVVCKKCHSKIHKQKGCNYQDYQCANKKEEGT